MAGSSYDNIINYGGNIHMGDVHHQGLSRDQQTLRSIIGSLRYEGMESRREMLAEAERGTFDWAFKDAEMEFRGRHWDWEKVDLTFKPWLTGNDEGMFCFLGKPGSGKSTFMKYLSHHPDVEETCQAWLQGRRLLRAEHSFWIAGTGLQNNYVGLLRNLLYQCLLALFKSGSQSDVQLVTSAFELRINSLRSHAAWDSRELEGVLSRLISSLPDTKCFFLVDGLDECEPQEQLDELARQISWISQFSNVKLCVSCRPWESLTQNLTMKLTLCIHQLTYNDMKLYMENRLLRAGTDAISQSDFREKTAEVQQLVHDIISAAEGVFLWLELMLNELVIAVRKNRNVNCLKRVFEKFPPDLNAYFTELIYQRISKEKSNVSDTASALKLAMVIHTKARSSSSLDCPQSVVNFWLLQNGDLNEEMPWYNVDVKLYSTLECKGMMDTTRRFLSETCRDLLVIVPIRDGRKTPFHANVEFPHRSVFDFLNSHDIKLEIENASPKHFEGDDFLDGLCKMRQLFLLRSALECRVLQQVLSRAVNSASACSEQKVDRRHLSMCDRVAAKHVLDVCNCVGRRHRLTDSEVMELLRNGCTQYFLALLNKWPHIATFRQRFDDHETAFMLKLSGLHHSTSACTSVNALFKVMLMYGLQPNQPFDTSQNCHNSLWAEWLVESKHEADGTHCTVDALRTRQKQKAEFASLMIQHGADPLCSPCILKHHGRLSCSRVSVNDIFQSILSTSYVGHIRSLLAEQSRYSVRQSAQRKQRLRAVRAFLVSDGNYGATERHADTDNSFWVDEKLAFVRRFMHDCMYGGERRQTCLTDHSCHGLRGALSSRCSYCDTDVIMCEACFHSSNGTQDLIANAFGNGEIANPQCVHAILQSSIRELGTNSRGDLTNRIVSIIKEWYYKNPLLEEEMIWPSDTDGEEMYFLINESATRFEEMG